MSSHNTLEPILNEILAAIKPLHNDRVTRLQIIDELREVVQSLEILRGDLCNILMILLWFKQIFIVDRKNSTSQ